MDSRGLPDSVALVLPCLLKELRAALGGRLVGVYAYGSVVSGGFDEGVSDIDLVVAVDGGLDHDLMGDLDAAHHRFLDACPEFLDRIDVIYAPAALLAGGPASQDLATVSPGSPFHRTPAEQGWSVNWQLVRDTGRTLDGLPVRAVVAAVPPETLRAAVVSIVASLREWAPQVTHRGGHAYVVLTACRAMLTLTTGRQASKAEAATWTRDRWPRFGPVIDAALEWRRGQADRDETPLPDDLAAQLAGLLELVGAPPTASPLQAP